jgi:hypothetical protein
VKKRSIFSISVENMVSDAMAPISNEMIKKIQIVVVLVLMPLIKTFENFIELDLAFVLKHHFILMIRSSIIQIYKKF